jgi:hypothetical protein
VRYICLVADQHDRNIVVSVGPLPHFFQPAPQLGEGLPPVRRKMQR